MAIMQASKLQKRVLELLGKEHDGTYEMASNLLTEMGLPKNGAPNGYTARQAGKLSDEELLELLPTPTNLDAEVETREERKAREAEEQKQAYIEYRERKRQKEKEYDERRRINNILRKHGYKWRYMTEEDWDGFVGDYYKRPEGWALFDKDGNQVDVNAVRRKLKI